MNTAQSTQQRLPLSVDLRGEKPQKGGIIKKSLEAGKPEKQMEPFRFEMPDR